MEIFVRYFNQACWMPDKDQPEGLPGKSPEIHYGGFCFYDESEGLKRIFSHPNQPLPKGLFPSPNPEGGFHPCPPLPQSSHFRRKCLPLTRWYHWCHFVDLYLGPQSLRTRAVG